MVRTETSGLPGERQAYQKIRTTADFIRYLGDGEFVAQDVPESHHKEIQRLDEDGIVSKVGRRQYDFDTSHNTRWVYEVEPWALEVAKEIVADRDAICPCGHSGVSNCGDHFECGFALCDREFARDELEAS